MSYRQLSQLNSEWDNSGENELLNRLNKVSAFAVNLLFITFIIVFAYCNMLFICTFQAAERKWNRIIQKLFIYY